MTCTRCGQDISASSSFCSSCGEPVRHEPTGAGQARGDAQPDPAAAQTEVLQRPRPGGPVPPPTSPFARRPEPEPGEAAEPSRDMDAPETGRAGPRQHWSSAEPDEDQGHGAASPQARQHPGETRPGSVKPPRAYAAPPTSAALPRVPAATPPDKGASPLDPPDRPSTSDSRSFADLTRSWPVEAVGAGVVACLALVKTLPALAVSLTGDASYPRGAVVALLLLTLVVLSGLTAVTVVRVVALRRAGDPTPQTLTLVAGGAVFVTVYALVVTVIATLTDDGSALLLLF